MLGEISWFLDPEADKQRSKLTFKVSYSNIIDQKLEHYKLHEAAHVSIHNTGSSLWMVSAGSLLPQSQVSLWSQRPATLDIVTATAIVISIQYNL